MSQKCNLSKKAVLLKFKQVSEADGFSQIFFKISVLKNFANFTRKKPVLQILFNKVAILKTLLKNEFNTGVFL